MCRSFRVVKCVWHGTVCSTRETLWSCGVRDLMNFLWKFFFFCICAIVGLKLVLLWPAKQHYCAPRESTLSTRSWFYSHCEHFQIILITCQPAYHSLGRREIFLQLNGQISRSCQGIYPTVETQIYSEGFKPLKRVWFIKPSKSKLV